MFEGGFGRNLAEHMKTVPWLMRTLAKVHAQTPLADQLQAAGITPGQLLGLFITHNHWDHIGAVEDLKGVPVFVNRTEREFIANGGEATALMRSFEPLNYQVYDFDGPAYAGFPASHDVFGDGSVVIVPIAGHTPGSVVAFVRTAQQPDDGARETAHHDPGNGLGLKRVLGGDGGCEAVAHSRKSNYETNNPFPSGRSTRGH